MYSKKIWMATPLMVLAIAGCVSRPWKSEPATPEVTFAFTTQNNLLFLPTVTLNGYRGRFLLGTATHSTILDSTFSRTTGARAPFTLELGSKDQRSITPVFADLGKVGDGIVGADAWGDRAITIDFVSGVITYQKEGIHAELMTLFPYEEQPAITIDVDGQTVKAIVDSSSPDTLIMPRASKGRGVATVGIAGSRFEKIDIGYANISQPHVGNRLLSKFLITIDYGRHEVGLWRDPRIKA
jgi:hypothetical protein